MALSVLKRILVGNYTASGSLISLNFMDFGVSLNPQEG
jgi:hypothetical protein